MHSKQALADTLNLYDVSALADYELYLAMPRQHASGLAVTRAALLATCAGRSRRRSASPADPFGFGFAWDQWDTTTHGAGLSVMATSTTRWPAPVYAAWASAGSMTSSAPTPGACR